MAHRLKATEERSTQVSAPVAAGATDAEALRQEIQVRAYYRYCERGCAPGADVDDWLAAEQEVLAVHANAAPSAAKASADDPRRPKQGRARR